MRAYGGFAIAGRRRRELMPCPRNKEVVPYAERVRGRIPARLTQVLELMKMKKYQFAEEAGISRQMLDYIERGQFIPGPCVMAQISCAAGMTFTEFASGLEDEAHPGPEERWDDNAPSSG